MKLTTRDLVIGGVLLLAFPVGVNLTALAADGDGRPIDDPLWHRGGDAPVQTADQR